MFPQPIAYLSHPLGEADDSRIITRQDNIANALEWYRFLRHNTSWAPAVPWLADVMAHPARTDPRGLRDNLAHLERSDFVVQVGGHVSPHMRFEALHATRRGIPVVDLTSMGYSPPWEQREQDIRAAITKRAEATALAQLRVAWMPPVTLAEVDVLRGARSELHPTHPAIAVLNRIIQAATRHA